MTIQDAYNKGLDDAENKVIDIFEKILRGEEAEEFLNPRLKVISDVIKARSDYYISLSIRNNTIGKSFRKRIHRELEDIDKSKS